MLQMKLIKADTLVIKIGFNPNKQLKQLKQHLKNLGLGINETSFQIFFAFSINFKELQAL
jgi:hypothetical protein